MRRQRYRNDNEVRLEIDGECIYDDICDGVNTYTIDELQDEDPASDDEYVLLSDIHSHFYGDWVFDYTFRPDEVEDIVESVSDDTLLEVARTVLDRIGQLAADEPIEALTDLIADSLAADGGDILKSVYDRQSPTDEMLLRRMIEDAGFEHILKEV